MKTTLFSARNTNLPEGILSELYGHFENKMKKYGGECIEGFYDDQAYGHLDHIWHIEDLTVLAHSCRCMLSEVIAYGDKNKAESLEKKLALKEFAKKTLLKGLEGK